MMKTLSFMQCLRGKSLIQAGSRPDSADRGPWRRAHDDRRVACQAALSRIAYSTAAPRLTGIG
jgi:hypothetical protein